MQRVTPPRSMASVGPQVRGDPTHCGVRRPRPRYFLRNGFFASTGLWNWHAAPTQFPCHQPGPAIHEHVRP